ncbi:MAG: hypothetical protein IPH93_17230 [Saprospiraceae bacterium]|nr:hypothetical protein [Saprospiraceae bacterium]MBK7811425.1 hypothetical protein [Saprospiraceae bacterium]MBK9631325.1 hypothetical protein [Saprospiraceae bacterium]
METISKFHRKLIILLMIMNVLVLLGQLWPEGAPPFARIINIVFLILNLLLYFSLLSKNK